MDKLNFEALEQIPIPEGLEERLSKKIDEWEQQARPQKKSKTRYYAVAASVALVIGIGIGHHFLRDNSVNLAEQDTFQDPVVAQQEAERALNLLALNLNRGMEHLEKVKVLTEKSKNNSTNK
ncbi:MAG: hypothetical protein IKV37_00545 [Prevotella sp.]|nr:hypothetical protein [Prevotella sp.]